MGIYINMRQFCGYYISVYLFAWSEAIIVLIMKKSISKGNVVNSVCLCKGIAFNFLGSLL